MARRDRVSLTLENGEENGERKREKEEGRGGSVIVNLSGTTGWLAEILKVPPRLNRNPAAEERAHRFTLKIN